MYIYILMIWYLIRVAKLKYNIIMSQSYPRGKVHIDTSQDPCILMLLMTGKVQPFFEYWHGPGRKSRVPERGTHCVEVWLDPLDNSLVTQRSVETWDLDHRSQSSTNLWEQDVKSSWMLQIASRKVCLWPGPTCPKCVGLLHWFEPGQFLCIDPKGRAWMG